MTVTWAAVAQNSSHMFAEVLQAESIDRALSKRVQCRRSVWPLYAEV